MERIRIDRRVLSLRARELAARDAEATPLVYAAGGGADVAEDLLARIDALLAEAPAAAGRAPSGPTSS
ncbi:MAG TPA: hypothetical protein VMM13_06490 [Euzebya sp.]|nr:hypothetical protein [Euzebya sp.]